MLKNYSRNLKLILIILLIFLLFSTHFFNNLKNLYSNNFEKRINNVYGFCENESIGFLKFLKNNFKLNNNPKIINYVHTPNIIWSILDPKKINLKSEDIILINYPGDNVELNYFIESKNNVIINDLSFYKDKIDKINSVEILFDKNYSDDIFLNLYSEINLGKRNLITNFNKIEKVSERQIKFNIDLEFKKIYPTNNNISFEIKNLNNANIKNIKILADNKYKIGNYNLIYNYQKCYLIKKK